MSDFSHGIKNEVFLEALRKLSAQESWWRDVLVDCSLVIALRDEYLNVYWQGQSIFKVAFQNGEVTASTHPKYLLNPDLSGQISLIGGSFDLDRVQAKMLTRAYEGPRTLAKLKRAAELFSGGEKEGVHVIAASNPSVVDVEIALSANGVPGMGDIPRLDLAAFEPAADHVELVFWEAKLFSNPGAKPGLIEVQIGKYQRAIEAFREKLLESYLLVARNLVDICTMSGGVRQLSETVRAVADGKARLSVSKSNVGMIVYGYDADQRSPGSRGDILRKNLSAKLYGLGIDDKRLKFRGDPKGLRL